MSGRELHRARVLAEIADGSRGVASGAALLGLTARHVHRLIERYRTRGPAGLAHGHYEMLLERHGLRVSRETLRSWMREDGLG